MDGRLKEAAEAINRAKEMKAAPKTTAKEKEEVANASERKAIDAEKAPQLTENKLRAMVTKLEKIELKLAKENSLNLAQANQISGLKDALEACEDKWYNAGFTEAANSVEPTIHQARQH